MMDLESSVISTAVGVIIHVLLALLFLFSSIANVLVIVIFYRRPALRTLSNRFVLSLLSFNLVATVVLLPLILIDSLVDVNLYSHGAIDYAVCTAGQAVTTLVTTGSISAALVIAIDQYCAVMAPLHYHRRVTKAKAWLLLAGQWVLAIAMAAFSVPDTAGKHFWKGCANSGNAPLVGAVEQPTVTDDDESVNLTSTVMPVNGTADPLDLLSQSPDVWTMLFVSSSVVCYVVPLALLSWMYLRIYSAAHRNSQRTRRTSLTHSASELVVHCLDQQQPLHHYQSANSSPLSGSLAHMGPSCLPESSPQQQHLQVPQQQSSRTPSLRVASREIVHNLRYRISNASLFLYREEARAARVSVFVLVLVVCCWMPYHVVLALHGWAGWSADHRLPSYAYHLTLVAVLINSLSSPFLYAYRSRRIQREVRRLFGLPPKSRKGFLHHSKYHHRDLYSKRRTKTLRSLSPRRQLLRKQIRGSDALSAEEVQAMSSTTNVSRNDDPPKHFMKMITMSRLWTKRAAVEQASSQENSTAVCAVTGAITAAASELAVVSVDISRSSFSSATSSNSSSSAESDVSL